LQLTRSPRCTSLPDMASGRSCLLASTKTGAWTAERLSQENWVDFMAFLCISMDLLQEPPERSKQIPYRFPTVLHFWLGINQITH
jgi:hypothetical protein